MTGHHSTAPETKHVGQWKGHHWRSLQEKQHQLAVEVRRQESAGHPWAGPREGKGPTPPGHQAGSLAPATCRPRLLHLSPRCPQAPPAGSPPGPGPWTPHMSTRLVPSFRSCPSKDSPMTSECDGRSLKGRLRSDVSCRRTPETSVSSRPTRRGAEVAEQGQGRCPGTTSRVYPEKAGPAAARKERRVRGAGRRDPRPAERVRSGGREELGGAAWRMGGTDAELGVLTATVCKGRRTCDRRGIACGGGEKQGA